MTSLPALTLAPFSRWTLRDKAAQEVANPHSLVPSPAPAAYSFSTKINYSKTCLRVMALAMPLGGNG